MLQRNSFVRHRKRASQPAVLQYVALSVLFLASIIGVVTFVHFSSSGSDASTESAEQRLLSITGYVEVLVPTQTIPAGVALHKDMFRIEQKPESLILQDSPRSLDDISGLYTKGVLLANQPINIEYLTNLQPVNALTASIPAGYRAIAITVDATSSVEGWAQPGARVDVIWVTNYSGSRTATVIAPNAKVLSANRRVEGAAVAAVTGQNGTSSQARKKKTEDAIPATVTLLLTARDAMRVRLAALHGRLSLVLRGVDDAGTVGSTIPIGESSLYNGGNVANSPLQPRNLVTVTVRDRETGSEENLIFENGQRINKK